MRPDSGGLKRAVISILALQFLAAAAVAQPTTPQSYPTKLVRLVVPFPAGGTTDVVARMVAQKLSDAWGHPVVTENRPGATGSIAAAYVKNAPADGYTLFLGTASVNTVNPSFRSNLPFDTLKDFAPVALLVTLPNMLVVHPSIAARSVVEFAELVKKNPGKFNYASGGIGTSNHLAMELFMQMTGTQMTHVPYQGSAPAMNDLIAGHVTIMFDNMTAVFPHVASGTMRGLGVASLQRAAAAPDVPAIAETLPGFEATSWVGILAPAGTPAEVVNRINATVNTLLADKEFIGKMQAIGAEVMSSTPSAFGDFIRTDLEKWRATVAKSNIKPN